MKKQTQEEFTFEDVILIPKKSSCLIEQDKEIDVSSFLTKRLKIKVPLVSANMTSVTESQMAITMAKMGGIGIIHQFMDKTNQLDEVRQVKKHNLLVGVAISDISLDIFEHIKNLKKNGCDVLVFDYAHAFNKQVIEKVKEIKKRFPSQELIVGNVVTGEAVMELIKAGADGIKVGIGPGSHCTTRIVTGFGRPQLSAISECAKVAKAYNVPIMADGGIMSSGDIVKALAFGASTVMVGGLFAGCEESPGEIDYVNGVKFKKTTGNGTKSVYNYLEKEKSLSKKAKILVKSILSKFYNWDQQKNGDNFLAEGIGGLIRYQGSAVPVINQLVNGLKRGMWYGGANNLAQLQKETKFVKITSAGLKEASPRWIEK